MYVLNGELPEDIRKSLQNQLLIPINLDEDPTSYVKKHEGLDLAVPAPYIDSHAALIKTDLLLDFIATQESVSLHSRSCVRLEYPDSSFLKFDTKEMKRRGLLKPDARVLSAAAHVQTTESTLSDTEANASTNLTPAMQSLIGAGIAKGLALALKTVSLTSKGSKGSFFCFAHHINKSHSTEACEFLKSKGLDRQLNKEMFK